MAGQEDEMRILGAIRQSKRKELSESPETQKRDEQAWADLRGHTIVGWAVDIGVSASISPFKRPALGPWLTDPEKLAQWDAVAFWKIDRAVRDMKHWYGDLVPEIRTRLGKELAAVTEGIDTATSSDIEIGMRVLMAQEELKKIRDRAKGNREGLRLSARWHGGIPPFGHYAERTLEGVKLAIDEDALDWIMVIKDKLDHGENPNAIARFLNQEGVLTAWDRHAVRMGRQPKGRLWNRTNLISMLQSRHHLGEWRRTTTPKAVKKSDRKFEVIRNPDGTPKKFGAPLMERSEWDEVQALLNKPKQEYRPGVASPLTRILHCAECGRPWYYRTPQGREKDPHYYCSSKRRLVGPDQQDCSAGRIPAPIVEGLVEDLYLDGFGDQEIIEVRATARVDYDSLIRELDEKITNLAAGLGALSPGGAAFRAVTAELTKAEAEREELEQSAKATQGIEYTHTGRTYGEEWLEADAVGRLDLLRKHNVYAMIQKAHGGRPNFIGLGMGHRDWTYTTMEWKWPKGPHHQ
jgi:site-specific DNA recombinase